MNQPSIQQTNVTVEPHRFGWFWIAKKHDWYISRTDIVTVAKGLGFCLYQKSIHRIVGVFVQEVDERYFQDCLSDYIQDTGEFNRIEVSNVLEAFMQKSLTYTISRLPIINKEDLLSDNELNCFKFFKNCFIHITSSEVAHHTYDQIPSDKLILYSKVQQRDFKAQETGLYIDFLSKSTEWANHSKGIKTIIGYLSHEFKDETTGYIVVLTEQCPDPKDGGGSGKNLFCNLLSNTTTYTSKNGKQIKFDEKFFQSWSGQRIMGISDVPKNFDFEFLKEPSTGTFILKKLFKDEVEVAVSDGPKFVVQTNYSFEISDGGLKRRIKPIEFTDFFTKEGGVDVHYGCHFPKGWSESDWNNFDTVIIDSVQEWLKSNRKIETIELTETGWEKQFEQSHGKNLAEFIRENFDTWVNQSPIASKNIQAQLMSFYQENNIDKKYQYSLQRVSFAIKEWAHKHFVECFPNKLSRIPTELNPVKCYIFYPAPEYVKPINKEPEF